MWDSHLSLQAIQQGTRLDTHSNYNFTGVRNTLVLE